MKRFTLFLSIALLTFVIGVYATVQANRAAHYIWPDFDPEPAPPTTIQEIPAHTDI
jgi:hypothetical protein